MICSIFLFFSLAFVSTQAISQERLNQTLEYARQVQDLAKGLYTADHQHHTDPVHGTAIPFSDLKQFCDTLQPGKPFPPLLLAPFISSHMIMPDVDVDSLKVIYNGQYQIVVSGKGSGKRRQSLAEFSRSNLYSPDTFYGSQCQDEGSIVNTLKTLSTVKPIYTQQLWGDFITFYRNNETATAKQLLDLLIGHGDDYVALLSRLDNQLVSCQLANANLGEGSYGQVFPALCVNDPTKVVILKKIPVRDLFSVVSAFREIQNMDFLKNDNIQGVRRMLYSQMNGPYEVQIIMEFLEGKNSESLANFKPPLQVVGAIIRSLFQTLHQIHEKGIIHSDVKSPNLIITTEGDVKLIDFGSAQNGSLLRWGTKGYSPPEYEDYNVAMTPAYDTWSVGATAVQLLTNSLFPNESYPEKVGLMIQALKTVPDSDNVVDFVTKCCQLDPSARINFSEAMVHPFITGAYSDAEMKQWLIANFINK